MTDERGSGAGSLGELEALRDAVRALKDAERARQEAESELTRTNEVLERIFSTSGSPIAYLDRELRFIRVNRAYAEKVGIAPEGFVGKSHIALYPNEENEAILRRVVETGEPYEAYARPFEDARDPERGVTYWNCTVQPVRNPDATVGGLILSLVDVTERERAAIALRDSEERYRSLVTAMSEGVVLQDASGFIVTANASAERILGLPLDQLVGRTSVDPRWHPIRDDGTPFEGEAHPAMVTLRTGHPCSGVIMGVHKPDGTLTWISIDTQPLLRTGSPRPYAVVSSFTDVTARKAAEEEVRASEARYRSLFENAHVALLEEDFTEVKQAIDALRASGVGDLRAYFAQRPEEAFRLASLTRVKNVNRATLALFAAADKARFDEGLPGTWVEESFGTIGDEMATLAEGRDGFGAEVKLRTLSGDIRTVSLGVIVPPGPDGGWDRVVVSLLDITERKKAEDERQRLVLELRESLAKIRTLSGLLPICASCKKIRDDHGYWSQVEQYLSEHTDVRFSHGLCPDCVKKFFPE